MWGPGNWSTKKVQDHPADQHSFTYLSGGVALEGASVDLHLGTARPINCTALLSWMSRPGNWSTKKVQERSADQHSFTYLSGGVALEGAGVDLHTCTFNHTLSVPNINCSALLSWMSGPRTWKNNQERSADQHSFTYIASGVGVEGRVMDDKSSILYVDGSSPLEVVCGAPPGIGAKI
jgi:hypothetical protein